MQNYLANMTLMLAPSHLLELRQSSFNQEQIKPPPILITESIAGILVLALIDFKTTKFMCQQQKVPKKAIRLISFQQKRRLPNTNRIDCLSAALEDSKHECISTNDIHPVVNLKHGTNLNKAIGRMKELFQPAITTASNLINNLSTSKVNPNLVPRVVGTLFQRVDTVPIHKNSKSLRPLGVREVTNTYSIGTNIRKNFDGTFYCGKIH